MDYNRETINVLQSISRDENRKSASNSLQPANNEYQYSVQMTTINLYKYTKIKTAHYVTTSNVSHVQLVPTFQKYNETKLFRSIFREAEMFADQLYIDVDYDFTKETTIVASNKDQTEVS